MITPWVFAFLQHYGRSGAEDVEPGESHKAFAWHLDFWPRLEEIGFEGIFFSEHHFNGSLSPSPNLLIASIAARTQTLRLGVMGQVLPLHHPWRVAEEIAMLDHLTEGRLEIGYSSGAGPQEAPAVGIPAEELRPRFAEALDIVDAALRGEMIEHRGRFWKFSNLNVTPRPFQQPSPRKWMTVVGQSSAAMAARRGYRICTGFSTVEEVKGVFDAYRKAAKEADKPTGPAELAIRRQVYIADTDSEAQAIGKEANRVWVERIDGFIKRRFAAMARAKQAFVGNVTHDVSRNVTASEAPSFDGSYFVGPDEVILGSPRSVADQIIAQCRKTGAGHILAYTSACLEFDEVARCHELWRQVIPLLRRADVV